MDFFYWLTHQFSIEGAMQYRAWYELLEKPFFAPPAMTFGIAWAIVYPLIALAFLWTAYLFYVRKAIPRGFLWLFLLNLALNLSFTATALTWKSNALTSLHILLVLGTLAWMMVLAWRYSKVIFILLVPYLLWGTFATVLQLSITALN